MNDIKRAISKIEDLIDELEDTAYNRETWRINMCRKKIASAFEELEKLFVEEE